MKTHRLIGIVTALCLALPAFAVEAEIDRKQMKQDLDIMEGILKSLHAQNTPTVPGFLREPHVRGLYFENYGVIFLIEERPPPGFEFAGVESFVPPTFATGTQEKGDVAKEGKSKGENKRLAFQERLREFLGTYADAIRQLKDEDRITILTHHRPGARSLDDVARMIAGESEYFWAVPDNRTRRELSEQVYSEVTANKSDIVAYRRERISEADFRKRIVSRDRRPDGSMMRKIGVMATILDKALTQPVHPVPRIDATLGIYQKGLGALFFVNAKSGPRTFFRMKTRQASKPTVYRTRPGKAVKGDTQYQERLKDELVEAVGDYGYTLRTLKPEEYIVVEVRFPAVGRRSTSSPRGLVLTVQKKNVDAYSRGDLDLETFRQKADIQEY